MIFLRNKNTSSLFKVSRRVHCLSFFHYYYYHPIKVQSLKSDILLSGYFRNASYRGGKPTTSEEVAWPNTLHYVPLSHVHFFKKKRNIRTHKIRTHSGIKTLLSFTYVSSQPSCFRSSSSSFLFTWSVERS